MARGVLFLTRGADVYAEYPTLHAWVERARPDIEQASALARDALTNVVAEDAALARYLNVIGFVPGVPDGLRVLGLLALELTLRSEGADHPDSRIPDLALILMGCLNARASASKALVDLIADRKTLTELSQAVEAWADPDTREHKTFGRLWFEAGLGSTAAALLAEAELRRRRLAGTTDSSLRGQIAPDALTGAIAVSDPAREDEAAELDFRLMDGTASEAAEGARAEADIVWRRTYLDLAADPDRVLPVSLANRLISAACVGFTREITQVNSLEAERLVGLQLVASAGIAESELSSLVFGDCPSPDLPWVLDLSQGAILRAEARESRKTELELAEQAWQKTGGPVYFPLAPILLDAIRRLLRSRGITSPPSGSPVLPGLREAVARGARPELRHLMDSLLPGLAVSPNALRARIAATLSRELGPEVAQLALGDAFSLSPAVVSYSRTEVSQIARVTWSAAAPLFGEDPAQLPASFICPEHFVGSRFAPRPELLRAWALGLRQRRDREARNELRDPAPAWRSQAMLLATLLMAVTGHRPNRAIEAITLYDFVPEYGLVTLGDKLSDPAHLVRVSAVGGRALIELKRYGDLLARLSRRTSLGSMADLAKQILLGEVPLFSLPGAEGEVRTLSARDVLEAMPAELFPVPNVLRHHLNQRLQSRGTDPELRHAQLGWQVTPCHALADVSPLSAVAMAGKLKEPLDALASEDGWVAASLREAWDWDGVPLPPLIDWQDVEASARHEHQRLTRQLVTAYQERSESCRSQLWDPLCQVIREILAGVEVDRGRRRLVRNARRTDTDAVVVTPDAAALIVERACDRIDDPIAPVVARQELVRLLRAGHRDRVVAGHIPRYQKPSFHSVPSPFLRNSGLAVRQINRLRQAIANRIGSRDWTASPHEPAVLFLLSVLVSSPYRSLVQAQDMARGLVHVQYSPSQPHLVRIPSAARPDSHYVLGGDLAVLAERIAGLGVARWPGADELVAWVRREAPELLPAGLTHQQIMGRLEATARTAARLELNGPERVLLINIDPGLSVQARVAIAAVEDWPAAPAQTCENSPESRADQHHEGEPRAGTVARRPGGRSTVDEIVRILNPQLGQTLPRTGVAIRDGQTGWRSKVERELAFLSGELGDSRATPALIARYAIHLLSEGGRRKRDLADATPHTLVSRFGNRLYAVAQAQPLADLDEEAIERIYLATIARASAEIRQPRKLLAALREFHRYLTKHENAPEVDWALASERAGLSVSAGEAGLLRDAEIALVDQQLAKDIEAAEKDTSVDPRERRLRMLRRVAFLILEASGIRPASVHGLTHGDLHLGGQVDYVHVRSTGRYGSAKTPTSRGFVPLEGALWNGSREWVLAWLASEQARLGSLYAADLPVFGEVDRPRERERRAGVLDRCNELLRWATGNPGARAYWLRKTRVTARHRSVMTLRDSPRAHDLHSALAVSGHASVTTPLTNYVSDPAVPRWQHGLARCEVGRAELIHLSGFKPATLDMAWQRAGAEEDTARVGQVLLRLHSDHPRLARITQETSPTPPPIVSKYRALRLIDVESFLLDVGGTTDEASRALRLGVTDQQLNLLLAGLQEWEERTGISPRGTPGMLAIRRPRRLGSLEDLRGALLTDQPSEQLVEAAGYWALAAARARPALGLAYPVTSERERTTAWLRSLDLEVQEDWYGGVPVLTVLHGRSPATHTLQWILMCTWVYKRV